MPTTITFSGVPDLPFSHYDEQGFSIVSAGNFPDAFLNGKLQNPVGDGKYVLANYSTDRALLQRDDGTTFGVTSVDLNGFAWKAPGVPGTAAITFFFRGFTAAGAVEGSFRTDSIDSFQTVNLANVDARFASGLFAFEWWAGDGTGWGSFDNLVVQPNRAPVAQDVAVHAPVAPLFTGHLTATDADGQTLSFQMVGAAPQGVRIDPDGAFYVTANASDLALPIGQSRVVTFQYRATDGDAFSATKTVTVTLEGQTPRGQAIDGNQHPNLLVGTAGGDTLRGYQNNDILLGGAGDDRLIGDQDTDLLNGGSGNDTLDGGVGKDILIGGGGNDWLIGGSSQDVFVFDPASGDDVIVDFKPNNDTLQFNAAMFGADASYAGIMSHARQVGANVEISYMGDDDRTHILTLLDVSRSALKAGDFLFG